MAATGTDPEVVVSRPCPGLAGQVRGYCGYREAGNVPVRRREVPGGRVAVIVSFGEAIAVDGVAQRSFVAGMHDGPAITEHAGSQHGVQVDLAPLAARSLLGVPMHHLTNEVVPLSEVLDGSLSEQLAGIGDWGARFELLDKVISSRLADAAPPDPAVRWAYQRIASTHGRVKVSELTEGTGWSRQHLASRFRDQVGLTPKGTARVLRFEHALRLLGGRPLSEVAVACGYSDQAHLAREVRGLAGCTARELELTFVQDAVDGRALS